MRMNARLELFASVSTLALLSLPGAASAQCVTNAADETVCSGTITTPQVIENLMTGVVDVVVEDTASITTSANDQSALRLRGFDSTTVINGNIVYSGLNTTSSVNGDAAVLAESGAVPASANTSNSVISLLNNGSITADNGTTTNNISGVIIRNGVGDIDFVNSSTGAISANWDGVRAYGLTTDLTVSASNAGIITAGGSGLRVDVQDGGVATAVNSGTIISNRVALAANVSGDDATLLVDNSGTLRVSNDYWYGMLGNSFGYRNDLTLINSGAISTQGVGSTGIVAFLSQNTDLQITNEADGVINVVGENGNGIWAYNEAFGTEPLGGDMLVTNRGAISSTANAVIGVNVFSDASDSASIVNAATGDIDVTGFGVQMAVEYGSAAVTNEGSINSAAFSGVYVTTENGVDIDVDNSGTISGPAAAIQLDINSLSGGGDPGVITIDNSGVLTSSAGYAVYAENVSNGNLYFTNSGSAAGDVEFENSTDSVINTGVIDGDILFHGGNDELLISGSAAAISGDIDGGADLDLLLFDAIDGFTYADTISNFETLSVSNGNVAFSGASVVGATNFTVAGDGVLNVTGGMSAIAASAGVDNLGTISIAPGAELAVSGDYRAGSGARTVFGADTAFGKLSASGDISFDSNSLIEIDVLNEMVLADGTTFDAAVAGGALSDASGDVVDNSYLFDFTKMVVSGDTLRITIEQALLLDDAVAPTGDQNSVSVASALQGYIDSGSPAAASLATALGQFPDEASLAGAVETFRLNSSNSVLYSHIELADDLLALQPQKRSLADMRDGVHLWGAFTFGRSGLGAENYRNGFDADRRSYAVGVQRVDEQDLGVNFGLAYAYSTTDGEENAARAYDTEGTAHTVLGFASTSLDAFRLHGALGYSSTQTDARRDVPVLNETAFAEIDGDAWIAEAEIDYIAVETGDWRVAPTAGLRYVDITLDEYQEAGSLAAVSVDKRSAHSLRAQAGVKASWTGKVLASADWRFEGYALLANEFGDLDDPYAAAFSGGQSFAVDVNTRDDFSANIGGGVAIGVGANTQLSFGYDGSYSGDYASHAATVKAQLLF